MAFPLGGTKGRLRQDTAKRETPPKAEVITGWQPHCVNSLVRMSAMRIVNQEEDNSGIEHY